MDIKEFLKKPIFFLSGALFEDGEDSQQAAFMFAVDMTNADRSVLVRTKLVAHPEQIPRGDSFKATKKSKLEIENNSIFASPQVEKILCMTLKV